MKTVRIFAIMMIMALIFALSANALLVMDNCDKFTANTSSVWSGTNAAVVSEKDDTGRSGYIKATPADGLALLTKNFTATDITKDTYLFIDIYVSDAASITNGQLELTSSGRADTQESSWEVTSLGLTDGWNSLQLDISGANAVSGGLDPASFNFIRFYSYTSNADSAIGIDNVGFGTDSAASLVIDNCDVLGVKSDFTGNSWVAAGVRTVAADGKDAVAEGDGCIYQSDPSTIIIQCSSTVGYDISSYEKDGYLMFWLYTSDSEGTSHTGQIELTSSGSPDSQEITWYVADLSNLQTGWNKIALPISTADKMSDVDFTKINMFRIYDFTVSADAPVELRVDNLCVGSESEAIEAGFLSKTEAAPETTAAVTETETVAETTADTTAKPAQTDAATETSAETTDSSSSADEGISTGLIIGIIAAAAVIIVVVAVIVLKKKKS